VFKDENKGIIMIGSNFVAGMIGNPKSINFDEIKKAVEE